MTLWAPHILVAVMAEAWALLLRTNPYLPLGSRTPVGERPWKR